MLLGLLAASIWPTVLGWRQIAPYAAIPTVAIAPAREVNLLRQPGLSGAQALALAPNGAIFVADQNNRRVLGFPDGTSESGRVIAPQPGTPAPSSPYGLTLAPDGDIHVLDFDSGMVFVYGQSGALLNSAKQASPGARALTIDASGNVFVGDAGALVIRKYRPDGQPDAGWGQNGTTAPLGEVLGLATIGDDLYASTGAAVLHLDAAGRVLEKSSLLGNGGMLAADPAGKLYLSDLPTSRVWLLDRHGAVAGRLRRTGNDEPPFQQPRGLAVTATQLYVVNDNRIGVYDFR